MLTLAICSFSAAAQAGGDYCTDVYDGIMRSEVPHKNPNANVEAEFDCRDANCGYLGIRDVKTDQMLRYDPSKGWAAALNETAGLCWNPANGDEVFTSIHPDTGRPGLYRFNFKKHRSTRVAAALSKKGILYPKNISKDGKYLIVDYDADLAGGKEDLRRYIVNTKDGSIMPFKDFKKKHGSAQFMDSDISEESRKHEC